jgi:ABC-type glycerol-3-phosphate transport system substrate-binding protein
MSKLTRRAFLKAAGLTAGASVLAACAPVAPASAPAAAPAAPAAQATEAPKAAAAAPAAVKLELWTFVNTHARWFRSMAEDYKKDKNPNFDLNVSEIAFNDLADKLQVALQAGGVGAPDLVDIEQGRFGGYLRGTGDPGLVDLTGMLKEGGYMDKLVAAREGLYTYKGKTYGIEHALCPVVLYYRGDVFEKAGIDVSKLTTWDEWIQAVKPLTSADVAAITFPGHEVLLRQRDADYFDAEGKVALDSDLSIQTMQFILDMRDKDKVAQQDPSGNGGDAWWAALKEGKFLSVVGADWYAGFLKDNVPDLKGKWKAMPVPAFTKDGRHTSCSGGTGNCIVKYSKHIDEAWNFQQYSMLSVEGNVRRFELTNLFPPFIPAMTDKRLHTADEYFMGQDLGQLFADMGPNVPTQYQSPYRAEMNSKLTPVWQDLYDGKQTPDTTFKQVAADIRKVMSDEGVQG